MVKANQSVKENTNSNKGNPYHNLKQNASNPIVENNSEWRFPNPNISKEISDISNTNTTLKKELYEANMIIEKLQSQINLLNNK
jgi:hypothetical protein